LIRILIDTGVWISYLGQRKIDTNNRVKKARKVINYLKNNSEKYSICYSERTINELYNNSGQNVLDNYTLVNSHIFNENWEECHLIWNNINSIWGDKTESNIGNTLKSILPDKTKKNNRNDRGIYGDAIIENCKIIIHENPKDFTKFTSDAEKRKIILIDLFSYSVKHAIKIIESL
jgi:hypothetical protein